MPSPAPAAGTAGRAWGADDVRNAGGHVVFNARPTPRVKGNRLVRAKRAYSGSIVAEYDYDGLFRRVRKYVTKQGVEEAPGDSGNTTVTTLNPTVPYYPIAYASPHVALSQIPYTGFDFGTVGNTLYWAVLALFALAAGYLIVYYLPSLKLRQASVSRVSLLRTFNVPVSRMAPTDEELPIPALFAREE